LTLAFARRLRALFWSAVGILCLIIVSNRKKREKIREKIKQTNEDITQFAPEQISSGELRRTSASELPPPVRWFVHSVILLTLAFLSPS
jgi:hypothetical protein